MSTAETPGAPKGLRSQRITEALDGTGIKVLICDVPEVQLNLGTEIRRGHALKVSRVLNRGDQGVGLTSNVVTLLRSALDFKVHGILPSWRFLLTSISLHEVPVDSNIENPCLPAQSTIVD